MNRRPFALGSTVALLLGLGVFALQAGAQSLPAAEDPPAAETGSDSLILTVQYDDLSEGENGEGIEARWIRPLSRGSLIAGASSFSIAGSRWTVGQLGWVRRFARGSVFESEGILGPGRNGEEDFTYSILRASWTHPLVPGRLFLRAGGQYIDVEPQNGSLLEIGTTTVINPAWTAQFNLGRDTSGNLEVDFVSVRTDITGENLRYFIGLVDGQSTTEPGDLARIAALGSDSERQYFTGLTLPLKRFAVTAVITRLTVRDFRRDTLVISTRVPLAARASP